MRKLYFLLLVSLLPVAWTLQAETKKIKVLVLGSSTAAGAGPSNTANAWVNQYQQYLKAINANNEVVNLAVGGYTTYQVMPSDFTVPANRPVPNTEHNITKALSYNPDVIIVNLPTNDAASNYTIAEQLSNYRTIKAKAAAQNIPVYIASTQPRNGSVEQRANLMAVRDSILLYYGTKAIDFWTTIANADGTINSAYNSGDGVHLNDAAHTLLKDRVVATDIMTYAKEISTHDTINIDFGSTPSTGKWNNLEVATANTVVNLVGTQNGSTGISIWIHDVFTGVNIAGTTTPSAALNMPSSATSDSFFGSVGAHNGVVEATGGFTMSGLDKNTLYSFTFFASRTGITDNRETKYKIVGATKDSVALDAANNTANTVSINNIKCSPNGTLTITVSPGANNTNASKYYFIGAMRITSEKQEMTTNNDPDGTINIDFGSKASTGTWNNMSTPSGAQILSDLVNTEGNSTGISLSVHDAFTGINDTGSATPDSALGIESNGSSDSFFGSVGLHSGVSEPTGGVTLSGLSVNSNYTLSFFASRDGVTDNRETKYTVTGSTTAAANLDAANNKSNMVTIPMITPATDGTIKIDVAPGINNTNSLKYYYLGVMRIVYAPESGTGINENKANLSAVSIYPNPFTNEVTFSSSLDGIMSVSIFDISGRLIHKLYSATGENTIKWDGINNSGIRVKSGMYVCHITSGKKAVSCKLQVK